RKRGERAAVIAERAPTPSISHAPARLTPRVPFPGPPLRAAVEGIFGPSAPVARRGAAARYAARSDRGPRTPDDPRAGVARGGRARAGRVLGGARLGRAPARAGAPRARALDRAVRRVRRPRPAPRGGAR